MQTITVIPPTSQNSTQHFYLDAEQGGHGVISGKCSISVYIVILYNWLRQNKLYTFDIDYGTCIQSVQTCYIPMKLWIRRYSSRAVGNTIYKAAEPMKVKTVLSKSMRKYVLPETNKVMFTFWIAMLNIISTKLNQNKIFSIYIYMSLHLTSLK